MDRQARILLVEGDRDMRTMLELAFSYYSLASNLVFTAPDIHSGLLQMRIVEPDLVILDLAQAGDEERQMLHRVRSESTAPLLLLLAEHDRDGVAKALDLGVDVALCKPLDFPVLHGYVRALLRRACGTLAPLPGLISPSTFTTADGSGT